MGINWGWTVKIDIKTNILILYNMLYWCWQKGSSDNLFMLDKVERGCY